MLPNICWHQQRANLHRGPKKSRIMSSYCQSSGTFAIFTVVHCRKQIAASPSLNKQLEMITETKMMKLGRNVWMNL